MFVNGMRQTVFVKTHLQLQVERCVKERSIIEFRSRSRRRKAFLNTLFKIGKGHLPSRNDPFFPEGGGEFGIKLSLSKYRSNERTILASEQLWRRARICCLMLSM